MYLYFHFAQNGKSRLKLLLWYMKWLGSKEERASLDHSFPLNDG